MGKCMSCECTVKKKWSCLHTCDRKPPDKKTLLNNLKKELKNLIKKQLTGIEKNIKNLKKELKGY